MQRENVTFTSLFYHFNILLYKSSFSTKDCCNNFDVDLFASMFFAYLFLNHFIFGDTRKRKKKL